MLKSSNFILNCLNFVLKVTVKNNYLHTKCMFSLKKNPRFLKNKYEFIETAVTNSQPPLPEKKKRFNVIKESYLNKYISSGVHKIIA